MRVIFTLTVFLISFSISHAQSTSEGESKSSAAAPSQYKAGLHYQLITPEWGGAETEPVIYEFFSYMCPGCNAFEPHMEKLTQKLNGSQKIIRVPVAFYAQWEPHAKAYYALQMMGELDQVHQALFAAIHQYKKPLRSLEDMAAWLSTSFGIDGQAFLSTAQSFAVDSQIRKGKQMAQAMGVGRVPTLVVNGRYMPNFSQLKTAENILDATVYLLNKK